MCTYLGVEIKMSTSNDGNQDESGSNEDFMVAYIALELMGSSTSAAKKEMVPTVPRMTGIQGVETQLNDKVECYNMHKMSWWFVILICGSHLLSRIGLDLLITLRYFWIL